MGRIINLYLHTESLESIESSWQVDTSVSISMKNKRVQLRFKRINTVKVIDEVISLEAG